jgi:hypothetical protein
MATENETDAPGEEPAPSAEQEELQRRLEEQLRRVRVQDLLLESVASILNLAARRISKPDERDLEQGRVGIEAVRAVLELLDEGPREQVREALSQVQMLYAREARGGGEPPPEGGEPPSAPQRPADEPKPGEPPPRLWTPPGST